MPRRLIRRFKAFPQISGWFARPATRTISPGSPVTWSFIAHSSRTGVRIEISDKNLSASRRYCYPSFDVRMRAKVTPFVTARHALDEIGVTGTSDIKPREENSCRRHNQRFPGVVECS